VEKGTILKISDDSGYLTLYNSSAYKSYVDEEWELQQLFDHFVNQMNQNSCLVWESGAEGTFNIVVGDSPSSTKAYRETEAYVAVTSGKLNLSNFEELSTAASYSDMQLPANESLQIDLENGLYKIMLRQIFNPEEDFVAGKDVDFELIFVKHAAEAKNSFEKIIWKEDAGE
jgi:hypothetical protein